MMFLVPRCKFVLVTPGMRLFRLQLQTFMSYEQYCSAYNVSTLLKCMLATCPYNHRILQPNTSLVETYADLRPRVRIFVYRFQGCVVIAGVANSV